MGRAIKIVLWILGGFVAVFVLAAVALTLFFDPNDFREEISDSVKAQTGRDLVIEGDIELDVFPWLAVSMGKTTLGNAPGFGDEPMASFESASFSVRLLPAIFKQEVVVGAADIDSLVLNLSVNKSGVNNWDDLAAQGADEQAAEEEAAADRSIDVNSVEIINARLTYSDGQSGSTTVLDQLNVNLGRLKDDGTPVPLTAGLQFDVQPAAMSGTLDLETTLAYDTDSGALNLGALTFDGVVEGIAAIPTTMAVRTGDIEIMTSDSRVALGKVDLTMFDIHIIADVEPFSYANKITPKASIEVEEFSPRSLMALFEVTQPETADPSVLSRVGFSAVAEVKTSSIDLSNVSVNVDDTSFTGSLSVPLEASGSYKFDLEGDSIELARYMAPASEEDAAASDEVVAVEIPVDLIRPLNARGSFRLARATLGNIVFENMELGLNAGGGKLRLFPVSSSLFGGSYNGDVRVDVSGSTPVLSLNEKVSGVDLAELAKAMFDQENVTGSIDGSFALAGRGKDTIAVQKNLSGNMSMELSDGSYQGTDIWYEIRRARALLKGEEAPEAVLPAKTDFSKVTMSGVVTDGIMRSDDLFAELPFMQLTGAGTVDIPAATVDYGLTARVLERPEFLEGATEEELDEYTEAVIPMKITGPLASPSIQPDLERLLRNRVEDEIKDKLQDKLKGLFD